MVEKKYQEYDLIGLSVYVWYLYSTKSLCIL